jgi:D-lactate dehydrogenase
MNLSQRVAFLSDLAMFDGVAPATLEALAGHAEIRDLAAGEYLFREGDPVEFMFVAVEGTLAVQKTAAKGVEITLRTIDPGEAGGLTGMAVAKSRSAPFLELLAAHADLAQCVIGLLGAKVRRQSTQLTDSLARTGSDDRFAVAVFDAKPYERRFLDAAAGDDIALRYFEPRLRADTAGLARGFPAVCAFVNDELDADCLTRLADGGVRLIALRCAGFNNVDLPMAAALDLSVVRVPRYSPHAVAEHTVALILALNRKVHRAYQRVREGNFSLAGLVGFDLRGRTAGIVGLGAIGRQLAEILRGFGMTLLAYDPQPDEAFADRVQLTYMDLPDLFARADIVTLNAPLTPETHHLVDAAAIASMKPGVMLINTGRGALIDTAALIEGLKSGQVGAAGLDVYEEESEYFFRDRSDEPITDDLLARLLTFPNVVVTSHQGFLTQEALQNIADTTLDNVREFRSGRRGADLTHAVVGDPA